MERHYAWKDLTRLPSLVSLSRLPLGLAFFLAEPEHPIVAFSLLAAAAVSDVLDGFLARARGDVTATGAVLDPIADKSFVGLVLLAFLVSHRLSGTGALLLATRDLAELPLLLWFAVVRESAREQPMANALGKATTVLQFTALSWLSFRLPNLQLWLSLTAGVGACAALSYGVSFARVRQVER